MNKLTLLYIAAFLALTLGLMLACAKKNDGSSSAETDTSSSQSLTVSSSLQNVEITDAESLFIVPGSTSSTTDNKLFKITTANEVAEVEYKDADNNSYTITEQPVLIDNIDTDYVVLSYGADKVNTRECYLTNKSTGAVYLLGSAANQLESKCPLPQNNSKEKTIL